ncbi:hypothetical protein [Paenibacillus segetis]|nr:hypothetical protein [Paenibacillus segetis]
MIRIKLLFSVAPTRAYRLTIVIKQVVAKTNVPFAQIGLAI